MSNRRDFLKAGAAVAAGGLVAGGLSAPAEAAEFGTYSRWKASHGGPPDSPEYMGKMVPGFRKPSLPPVPVQTPDTKKLPWTMETGRKTFRLSCEVVKQEFLPGAEMNVWGFNGSMPGPVIEVNQGDKVRIIVTNNLPEPTSVHWHGLEIVADMDGVPGMTQDLIPPGGQYVYEFDLHQAGSFFYHSHIAMQEAMGMVGWLIIHPAKAYTPTVDRDFALIFQNFFIEPSSMTPDSRRMDWNWHTINGRSGPLTTPLVVKHGERVRVRLLDFSPMQHHPIHLHGHTYWLTGTEAGRIPSSAWIPRNTTLVGVAMVNDFEFVANNPGDWIFHCHAEACDTGDHGTHDQRDDEHFQGVEEEFSNELKALGLLGHKRAEKPSEQYPCYDGRQKPLRSMSATGVFYWGGTVCHGRRFLRLQEDNLC